MTSALALRADAAAAEVYNSSIEPTKRFERRAHDYARARPSYPREVLAVLRAECGLAPESAVADLGSGTGIFTRLLLESGATVYAVEPNDEMRAAAERDLAGAARFRSIRGRAEATTLPPASIDLVTAAQAFHWFELAATKAEMLRIAKDGARAALIWNDRDTVSTPFLRELEAVLVAHCPRYPELQGKADARSSFDALFGQGCWQRRALSNEQRLDRDRFVARIASASYAPEPGTKAREAIAHALEELFDRHAGDGGTVRITYETVVISGRLGRAK